MKYSKIIEFDIWSSFGCFSKPFSNTGGILSYLIPPKTSIIGMIGAIIGINFNEFDENNGIKIYKLEKLYDIKVSIQPIFDLKTKRVTYNNVEGTTEETKISNIRQDILIKPYYKIFITFPDNLKSEEDLFLKQIKFNKTVYNLYMGKNEFPLNIKFIKDFPYECEMLYGDNISDYKIFGSLNRNEVKNVSIAKKSEKKDNIMFNIFKKNDGSSYLKSFYEYVVNDYPVKRWNFTNFTYSSISFYSSYEWKDCWFEDIELKEGNPLELCKIGENEWISMI